MSKISKDSRKYKLQIFITSVISSLAAACLALPANAECSPSKAQKLFRQQNFQATVQVLESCNSKDPSIYFYRGVSQYLLKKYNLAIEDLKIAIDLKPNSQMSWFYLGSAYLDLQDYQQAYMGLLQAVKLNPNHGLSWNDLGVAAVYLGYREDALRFFQQALSVKISPSTRKIVVGNIKTLQAGMAAYNSPPSTSSPSYVPTQPNVDGYHWDRDAAGLCRTYANGCND